MALKVSTQVGYSAATGSCPRWHSNDGDSPTEVRRTQLLLYERYLGGGHPKSTVVNGGGLATEALILLLSIFVIQPKIFSSDFT